MRPINKGNWPSSAGGKRRNFNDWKRAKAHLVARSGQYCHFCEMRVNNSLAVEHIKSRSEFPRLANNWWNFLLICTSCNSRKKAARLEVPYRAKYYWPHLNNTMLTFNVPLSGANAILVVPAQNLNPEQLARALLTIKLYGLDQVNTATGDSDNRFLERQKATKCAIDRRIEYMQGKATIGSIVDTAQFTGFFSVWFDVFAGIEDVKKALLQASDFKITQNLYFDDSLDLIPRNMGLDDPL